jgi:sugar (pentulose or hexulose) kinase
MDLVLGIDLGTSYFKLGLFDRGGVMRGLGRVPLRTDAGDGSLCELPARRFWSALRDGLAEALAQAGARAAEILALGYCSQANSFLLLDDHGDPLTPLILWPDGREDTIDPAVRRLWQRDDFLDVTGLGIPPSVGLCVSKVRWFCSHQRDLWSRTHRLLTISDYLASTLTGHCVGDAGTAALLGIWNVRESQWWDKGLAALEIHPSRMASLLRPGSSAGRLSAGGVQRLGLRAGIPLVVGSLDHHIAAVGAGVGQVAEFSESTGTVLACIRHTEGYRPAVDCCLGPGIGQAPYYQLAFDCNGAGSLEWYQRTHAPDLSVPDLLSLAGDVPAGCEGLVAAASANEYEGLKGFKGKSKSHGHGHFVRAIMESTAGTLGVLVDRLCPDARPERIVATGGGARSDLWLQMKADMLGVTFVRTKCREPACMGAAMVAAVTVKWFENLRGVGKAWVAVDREFAPA